MKDVSKSKKIIAVIIILILLAGIIMLVAKGFNKGITYQKATKIECYIAKGYNKSDIEQITNEVFNDKNVQIQDVEKLNQVVSVRINDYTEEELENFKTKISEKYGIEKDDLEIHEVEVPTTRIKTLVTPYVFPVSLVTILAIIYVGIRNITNKDMIKKVAKLLTTLIIVAGLYFSIIVLAQIPVNEYMMPIALALYVATLLITVIKLNKE